MKQIFLLLIYFLLLSGGFSCKRCYTCTCSGHGKSVSETKRYKTVEEAEEVCEGYNATAQQYGGNCALE